MYTSLYLFASIGMCAFVFTLILLNPIELHSFRSIFNAFFCIKININKHKINSKMRQTSREGKKRNNVYIGDRREKMLGSPKGKSLRCDMHCNVIRLVSFCMKCSIRSESEHSNTHTRTRPTFWTSHNTEQCAMPLCLSIFGII